MSMDNVTGPDEHGKLRRTEPVDEAARARTAELEAQMRVYASGINTLTDRAVAIAALFGNDLARAQEAAKMVEAMEWAQRNSSSLSCMRTAPYGSENQPEWYIAGLWGRGGGKGNTLPEAVDALRLKLEGEQT